MRRLIWVYTVCKGPSVPILNPIMIIMVHLYAYILPTFPINKSSKEKTNWCRHRQSLTQVRENNHAGQAYAIIACNSLACFMTICTVSYNFTAKTYPSSISFNFFFFFPSHFFDLYRPRHSILSIVIDSLVLHIWQTKEIFFLLISIIWFCFFLHWEQPFFQESSAVSQTMCTSVQRLINIWKLLGKIIVTSMDMLIYI